MRGGRARRTAVPASRAVPSRLRCLAPPAEQRQPPHPGTTLQRHSHLQASPAPFHQALASGAAMPALSWGASAAEAARDPAPRLAPTVCRGTFTSDELDGVSPADFKAALRTGPSAQLYVAVRTPAPTPPQTPSPTPPHPFLPHTTPKGQACPHENRRQPYWLFHRAGQAETCLDGWRQEEELTAAPHGWRCVPRPGHGRRIRASGWAPRLGARGMSPARRPTPLPAGPHNRVAGRRNPRPAALGSKPRE